MVTIGEVARYAGVSVATVSRVLNNSESVKPATAQRVMAAIRELDYIPNQSARNLRRSESRVILTLAPNFSNPYYSSILTGIGDLAHDCAYSVLICNTGGQAENEERFLKMLDAHRADGAIFLGCRKNNPLLREYAQHYPIVQCCEYVPEIQQPTVCPFSAVGCGRTTTLSPPSSGGRGTATRWRRRDCPAETSWWRWRMRIIPLPPVWRRRSGC